MPGQGGSRFRPPAQGTLKIVRSKRSLTLISRLSRNFLRKPAKHVLLTCLTIT